MYEKSLTENISKASKQCLYGVYTANLIKGLWAADTESSAFIAYSDSISSMFFESLHYLGGSRWPLFALLEHARTLKRHGFVMDFSDEELTGWQPFAGAGPWLQGLSDKKHGDIIRKTIVGGASATSTADRSMISAPASTADSIIRSASRSGSVFPQNSDGSGWRPEFRDLADAIVEFGSEHRFLFMSFVYGKYGKYIEGWGQRLKTLKIRHFLLLCLDDAAFRTCRRAAGTAGTPKKNSAETESASTMEDDRGSVAALPAKLTNLNPK